MIPIISVSTVLLISIILNIWLIYKLKKAPQKTTTMTHDAQSMLKDILNSGAMCQIRVLDAADYFVKSPRG